MRGYIAFPDCSVIIHRSGQEDQTVKRTVYRAIYGRKDMVRFEKLYRPVFCTSDGVFHLSIKVPQQKKG